MSDRRRALVTLAALVSAALLAPLASVARAQRLSSLEERLGWVEPFAGDSLAAWQLLSDDGVPAEGWTVEDGVLRLVEPGSGDLVSRATHADFELELEWRVRGAANSGVQYRVDAREPTGPTQPVGPEYPVLGPAADVAPEHAAAALYDVCAPSEPPPLAPSGGFHRARIVARGPRLEHWLGGRRVVRLDQGSDAWSERVAESEFADVDAFGRGAGRLLFQDHGDPVAYRRVRLRDWDRLREQAVSLVAGDTLAGWKELGDARYVARDGIVLGEVDGGGQSFLSTERTYGDFVLEVDVKTWTKGNSGIQIRSHETDDGRLRGYQIEIDPSDRAWSGGLYDEYRRGWLDDSSDDPAARAAFRTDEWNRYRIECMGPWIRTWIDGVPVADWFDVADLEGVIGLQVHSGRDTRVEWRDPRLVDLGRHVWRPFGRDEPAGHWELDGDASQGELEVQEGDVLALSGRIVARTSTTPDDFTLRLVLAGAGVRVALRHGDAHFEVRTTETEREVAFCRYADRSVWIVDGRLVADVRGAVSEPGPIELFVRTGREPLRLLRCERLVPE